MSDPVVAQATRTVCVVRPFPTSPGSSQSSISLRLWSEERAYKAPMSPTLAFEHLLTMDGTGTVPGPCVQAHCRRLRLRGPSLIPTLLFKRGDRPVH